jgi:hypothetical protein
MVWCANKYPLLYLRRKPLVGQLLFALPSAEARHFLLQSPGYMAFVRSCQQPVHFNGWLGQLILSAQNEYWFCLSYPRDI